MRSQATFQSVVIPSIAKLLKCYFMNKLSLLISNQFTGKLQAQVYFIQQPMTHVTGNASRQSSPTLVKE